MSSKRCLCTSYASRYRYLLSLVLSIIVLTSSACAIKIPLEISSDRVFPDVQILQSRLKRNHLQIDPQLTLQGNQVLSLAVTPEAAGIQLLSENEVLLEHRWPPLPTQLPVTRTIPFTIPQTMTQIRLLSNGTQNLQIVRIGINTNPAWYFRKDAEAVYIPSQWNQYEFIDEGSHTITFVFHALPETFQNIGLELYQEYTNKIIVQLRGTSGSHAYTLSVPPGISAFVLNTVPTDLEKATFFIQDNRLSANEDLTTRPFPVHTLSLKTGAPPVFPEPIDASIHYMLQTPPEQWRTKTRELYRWSTFPNILILASETLDIQRDYFLRLAFFVEKRGFRGQILSDAALSGRHGWNAHNYHSEDLARFFSHVEESLLSKEEKELRSLLVHNGIITPSDGEFLHASDEAGILGFAWNVSDRVRSLLLKHEALHGLYYEEKNFRTYVDMIWQDLPSDIQNFFQFMFSVYSYDGNFIPLVKNEMQAYMLQQPLDELPLALERIASNLKRYSPASIRYINEFFEQYSKELLDLAKRLDAFINTNYGMSAGSIQRTLSDTH